MYKKKKVILVLPAFNEEKLIGATISRAPPIIDKVIVVNDASTDKTSEIVSNHEDPRTILINHEKNFGVGQAYITGYRRALEEGADIIVSAGGDDQMPLEETATFLDPIINDEADYVKGNRFITDSLKDMPLKRLFGNSVLSFLTKFASGYWKIFDTQDGFTAMSKKTAETIDWERAWKKYGYPSDFLIWMNYYNMRVKDVPRTAIYYKGVRQSQIKIIPYIFRILPLLARGFLRRMFSKHLLRDFNPMVLFYMLSFLLIPCGLFLGGWLMYTSYYSGTVHPPWAILDVLLLTTGVQSFFFAIWFDMEANRHLQP